MARHSGSRVYSSSNQVGRMTIWEITTRYSNIGEYDRGLKVPPIT